MENLHLVSFSGSGSSTSNGGSPVKGSDRSSKLIINNEISSTSERMGAVKVKNKWDKLQFFVPASDLTHHVTTFQWRRVRFFHYFTYDFGAKEFLTCNEYRNEEIQYKISLFDCQ